MFKIVMMVCIGNVCRRPIAEVYLYQLQPDLNIVPTRLGALVVSPQINTQ